jgi:hypothetical protein
MSADMRMVGLTAAAATLRDADVFSSAFVDLSDEACDALGRAVLGFLWRNARDAWGWACNRIPWSYIRAVGRENWQRWIQTWKPPARPANASRSALCKIAFRLLRQGMPAKAYIAELRAANALLADPLAGDKLDSLAVWCFQRHMENDHAR